MSDEETWQDYGYDERPDYWCDICEEDVGPSSHYHCAKCLKISGMFGHYVFDHGGADKRFTCEGNDGPE